MDTLSHALWGGLAFGKENPYSKKRNKKYFWSAFFLGAGPDIVSFGPSFLGWALTGFPPYHRRAGEPPDLASIPNYLFSLYNITHSMIVWLSIFFILWILLRKPFWPYCAWLLHILCDIPTHTTRYFPTPFLWPFPTPFVNGFRWATRWFLIPNYILILSVSLILYLKWKKSGNRIER